MAYSQKKHYALRNTQLLQDFEGDHKDEWYRLATLAFGLAKSVYTDADKVRHDDVAPFLQEALEGSPVFRAVMRRRKQRAKMYYLFFADYILDQMWETLATEGEGHE